MAEGGRSALIVTLGRARGSLAAVRALSAAGWTVGVGTPDGRGMVTASRSCHRRHVVERPRGDAAEFVAGVRHAIDDGGYDVVFGGGDDWMAALSSYRDQIPASVAHPGWPVVADALDKVEVTRRALAVGLAAPRTEVGTDEALASWSGPVVVKCRAHWHPGQRNRTRIEARRYDDLDAAAARVQTLRAAGFEAVLQEPVDGSLSALIGLFHEGRLRGRVQQETTRLWPTPSGVSTRASTVAVDEDLAERCDALLAGLGWSGLVELQFLTAPGGRPHLIDLNGRFYGSMALANSAGANLPDAWGRQVLNEPVPELTDAPAGQRFLWAAGDLRRAFAERRGGLPADVRDVLGRLPGATTSVWDVRDVGPTVHLLTSRLRPRPTAAAPAVPDTAAGPGDRRPDPDATRAARPTGGSSIDLTAQSPSQQSPSHQSPSQQSPSQQSPSRQQPAEPLRSDQRPALAPRAGAA